MKRRMYRGGDLQRVQNVDEMRGVARCRVPNFCFEFLDGASEDEVSLKRNRSVFNEIAFRPQALVDVSKRDIGKTILGERCEAPFVIGPTGFSGLLSNQGDLSLARAAAASGIPYVLSNVSTVSLEDICDKTDARVWMQIYLYRNRSFVEQLVKRLLNSRIDTIVLTVDNPVHGKREWDSRNYRGHLKLSYRNMLDVVMHPRWMADVLIPNGFPRFANLGDLLEPGKDDVKGAAHALASQLSAELSWDDVRWLRDLWPRKLLIKGLLNKYDVMKAAEAGADGVILSNHGGRQLDGALSSMEILPEVMEAVRGRIPVLLDGGFRRGSDIVKALALGAEGVLLGRATSYGLAAGGQPGAQRVIDILKEEISRVIALLGCPQFSDLDARYLDWELLRRKTAEWQPPRQ